MSETSRGYGNHAKDEASSTGSFFHKAARFSLIAPGIAIACNAALILSMPYLKKHVPYNLQMVGSILSLVMGGLIILGFILAIIALLGIPKHGAKGILIRSMISIIYNGTVLGLAATIAFPAVMKVRAKESNPTLSTQIDEAVLAIRSDVQKRLGKPASPIGEAVKVDQDVQSKLDKAAREYGGEAAVTLKGASGFLHKVVSLEKDYEAKGKAILFPPATSPEGLAKREDFADRRKKVTEFIDASRKLKEFIKNSDAYLQEELKKNNIPAETIEKAMAGYRSQAAIRNTAMKFWGADQRLAGAMLGVLDILDNNWGKWKYEAATKRILFDDKEALKYFNFYVRDIQDASVELKGLHEQLLAQIGK